MTHPRAGQPALPEDLIDPASLVRCYYERHPDPSREDERVFFGTSGHRGSSLRGTFNEDHILAITQAICNLREHDGASGPLFMGIDTHALSVPAAATALEVLVANGVEVVIDERDGPTPTPVVCHAILQHNRGRTSRLADGIAVTPSHNPPEDGGFKYHTVHGGVASGDLTERIGREANRLLESGLAGVRRVAHAVALSSSLVHRHDYREHYVADLTRVVDFDPIRHASLRLAIDPMGGAGVHYWGRIAEMYGFTLEVLNSEVDPTFRFMHLDHDGRIRLDPSSPYVMRHLATESRAHDLILACDTDHDRHGIIVSDRGLIPANHYITALAHYLMKTRPEWPREGAVGTTVATTVALTRITHHHGREIYETPVGFKWFAEGLYEQRLVFGGEESAGASCLGRDGSTWTTDKDGIVAGLLAAEMTARWGRDPGRVYDETRAIHGNPQAQRWEYAIDHRLRQQLLSVGKERIVSTGVAGEPWTRISTTASGNGVPIGGIKLESASSWLLIRPSGTELVCKIYAETLSGGPPLETLHTEALEILEGMSASA